MTLMASSVLKAATKALADLGDFPPQDPDAEVLAARTVSSAVLSAIGGSAKKDGLFPFNSNMAQQLLALADEIKDEESTPGETLDNNKS